MLIKSGRNVVVCKCRVTYRKYSCIRADVVGRGRHGTLIDDTTTIVNSVPAAVIDGVRATTTTAVSCHCRTLEHSYCTPTVAVKRHSDDELFFMTIMHHTSMSLVTDLSRIN